MLFCRSASSAEELEVLKSEEGREGVESVRIWVRRKAVLRSIIDGFVWCDIFCDWWLGVVVSCVGSELETFGGDVFGGRRVFVITPYITSRDSWQ